MALLIGIDEAGYGPLLGPLVVSAAAFEIPAPRLGEDLWKTLSPAVAREKRNLRGRLLINDSKKVYSRKTGVKTLRRTVLSALLASNPLQPLPATARQFLDRLCPLCARRLDAYPWYAALSTAVFQADSDISLAAGLLSNTLLHNGLKMHLLQSRCIDVEYFNQRTAAVKNKARVLFTELCSLIDTVLRSSSSAETCQFLIDQQGGRTNYCPELQRMFPDMTLKILKRENNISSYELTDSQRSIRLHFVSAADRKYLPVSLASMISKYIREILMEQLNQYFLSKCDIPPTAGYWQDGSRFIADLSARLPESDLPKHQLIRIR